MPFLRVMTFNMQLLPAVDIPVFQVHLGPKSGSESPGRAVAIGDAIAALPDDELPDVLIGNEVFHEDARDALLKRLRPRYPHIVESFPDAISWPTSMVVTNSGLFFASRYPIHPFPDGSSWKYVYYASSADWDRYAAKGLGVVGISTPFEVVTLAFTHTQASTLSEDEHADIRAKQFAQVDGELQSLFGPPPGYGWSHLVVAGDLNVRGDPGATAGEWETVFANGPTVFTTTLTDGWDTYMHPPGTNAEVDPGYTNNNLEPGNGQMPAGTLSRLDYVITQAHPDALVPQHMRTRFRALSDHWSLEADLHWRTSHCTPSDAVPLGTIPKLASGLQVVPLGIVHDGSYQWVYVPEPGTYTVFPPAADVEVAMYHADHLSDARAPYDVVDLTSLGIPQLETDFDRNAGGVEAKGQQYVARGPFFLRARGRQRHNGYTGPAPLGVFRHTGETPASAIFLEPWMDPVDPVLPAGQPLGAHDEVWFRARIDRAHSGATHTSVFEVRNATGGHAVVELQDDQFTPLGADAGSGPVLAVSHATDGPATVYLRLQRSTLNQVQFRAGWRSGITYLRSEPNVRPLVLRCVDETGPDWLGSDEITLRVRPDGMIPFVVDTYWDDADTNEILMLETLLPTLAFVSSIEVWVGESDFIQEHPSIVTIAGLGSTPTSPAQHDLLKSIPVQTGTYQFEGLLSRWPD